jgi:hypothetical protein
MLNTLINFTLQEFELWLDSLWVRKEKKKEKKRKKEEGGRDFPAMPVFLNRY